VGGVFSIDETGSNLGHQRVEGSRCLEIQHPGAGEIRFIRLGRFGCRANPRRAENAAARHGGERAEKEIS
jgi:hypothetical protein